MLSWLPQSSPSHPLDASVCSQHQPSPWDCSTIPKLQLPATAHSRGPVSLSRVMYSCGKDCLILISFRLPQISSFTLSLKCFSSDSDNCLDHTPASVPPPAKGRSCPTNNPVFHPSSFIPTEFCMVLYICFHWSGTPVHSQLVFCMLFCVLRRIPDVSIEIYSMSTYSSTILFFLLFTFKILC